MKKEQGGREGGGGTLQLLLCVVSVVFWGLAEITAEPERGTAPVGLMKDR